MGYEIMKKFDYAEVPQETADSLHKHENIIRGIQSKAIYDIGEELQAAHDELANHRNGIFYAWCESIGIKATTVDNILGYHKFIAQNLGNKTMLDDLPKSLIYSAAKPSAPEPLKNAVLAGDITTNKQYQEELAKFKARAEQAEKQAAEANARILAAENEARQARQDALSAQQMEVELSIAKREAKRNGEGWDDAQKAYADLKCSVNKRHDELMEETTKLAQENRILEQRVREAGEPVIVEHDKIVPPADYESIKRELAELKAHQQNMSLQQQAEADERYSEYRKTEAEEVKTYKVVRKVLSAVLELPESPEELAEFARCYLAQSITHDTSLDINVTSIEITDAIKKLEVLKEAVQGQARLRVVK